MASKYAWWSKLCTLEELVKQLYSWGVYVADLIVTGDDPIEINNSKQQMTGDFEMSDLGLLSYYLGIEVEQKE